jgi:hypothetical protein
VPEPRSPRDRLAVHFGWEIVLLLGAAAVGVPVGGRSRDAAAAPTCASSYVQTAVVGAVTVGMALSLRAAVPNLRSARSRSRPACSSPRTPIAGILVTGRRHRAARRPRPGGDGDLPSPRSRCPAWAASLGAGLGLIVWIQITAGRRGGHRRATGQRTTRCTGSPVSSRCRSWAACSAWCRRCAGDGRYRPVGDPSVRAGRGVGGARLTGSSILAAAAGVLLALDNREIVPTRTARPDVLALGAALLGGTSVYGATVASSHRAGGDRPDAAVRYAAAEDRAVQLCSPGAAAIAVGLMVSRLVETLGRPKRCRDASPSRPGAASAPRRTAPERSRRLDAPSQAPRRIWRPAPVADRSSRRDRRWTSAGATRRLRS